jgi:hypothetical protein
VQDTFFRFRKLSLLFRQHSVKAKNQTPRTSFWSASYPQTQIFNLALSTFVCALHKYLLHPVALQLFHLTTQLIWLMKLCHKNVGKSCRLNFFRSSGGNFRGAQGVYFKQKPPSQRKSPLIYREERETASFSRLRDTSFWHSCHSTHSPRPSHRSLG